MVNRKFVEMRKAVENRRRQQTRGWAQVSPTDRASSRTAEGDREAEENFAASFAEQDAGR